MPPESEWKTDEDLIEFYKRMERQELPDEYDSTKLGNFLSGPIENINISNAILLLFQCVIAFLSLIRKEKFTKQREIKTYIASNIESTRMICRFCKSCEITKSLRLVCSFCGNFDHRDLHAEGRSKDE